MPTRNNLVAAARTFLGCKESDGTHKKIIDLYNNIRPLPRGYKLAYTDAWCAGFVSAVAYSVGALSVVPAECSCAKMVEGFKKLGTWVENDAHTPTPGDVIFYDWQDSGKGDNTGNPDHVGIVEEVKNGKIVVIEGNYNNAVQRRTLDVNGLYIRGYGVPAYPAETPTPPPTPTPTVGDKPKYSATVDSAITTLAKAVINGDFGNGAARKENLYKTIQTRVNEILSG